jgi:hypothetical protein
MKKSLYPFVLVVVALLLTSSVPAFSANGDDCNGYPLIKGNYWIYQGKRRWTEEDGKIIERMCTVRMDVLEVIKRDSLTVAVVRGALADYAAQGSADSRDHLIIRAGATAYFDVENDRVAAILRKVKDPKENLFGLLRDNEEPILDLPLVLGKRYGDPTQMTREDPYYCWMVTKDEEVALRSLKGLKSPRKRRQFTLRYLTLLSEVLMDFVPGVGITRYRFRHRGSVIEADLKLIEFGRASQ